MLTGISVSNFAIITHSEVEFSSHFNVITGETGAGKSILLGALSLILGHRADLSVLSDKTKKCIVEAHFKIEKDFVQFFAENDLDFEMDTIVRRELSPSGKSRAFINDTPVNLNLLRELTSKLVDLHQQHDSRSVAEADFQRQVVDVFANTNSLVTDYHEKYLIAKSKQRLLEKKRLEQAEKKQQSDFLQFQYDELEAANLQHGELEKIEAQLKKTESAEEILTRTVTFIELINDGDTNTLSQLQSALSELRKLAQLNEEFTTSSERFESIVIDLEDFIKEFNQIDASEEIEESQKISLQERTDLLNRLMQKHQKNDEAELLALHDEIKSELESLDFLQDELGQLEKEIDLLQKELKVEAEKISAKRKSILSSLSQQVIELLSQVGMPNAIFEIQINQVGLNAYGQDEINFLFSANSGMAPMLIKQIASGGELSRLMLALKSVVAGKSVLPTLIFDEIDTGISGEVAKKVGIVMHELGNHHQVIAITHSPQVAAKGDLQFKIYKEESAGKTSSIVKQLTKEERINEIAEMLSGANPSDSSITAAKELMN